MTCIKCGSERVHRSHRSSAKEYLYSLGGLYPYRCNECRHRFLTRRRRHGDDHPTDGDQRLKTDKRKGVKRHARTRMLREALLYAIGLLGFLLFVAYFVLRQPQGPPAQ